MCPDDMVAVHDPQMIRTHMWPTSYIYEMVPPYSFAAYNNTQVDIPKQSFKLEVSPTYSS